MLFRSYTARFEPGACGVAPGALSDSRLAEDALASLRALASRPGAEQANPFIQDFLDGLDAALAHSGLRRTACKAMPYRLRVSVADATRRGQVDFTYDGSATWTSAQEVGGPGSTHGLYDEIQRLMAIHRGGGQ